MPDVLRESHFQAQCVVRVTANDVFLYDMLPMEAKAVVGGLVVDIGTTTVSALIVDMLSGEILAKASSGNGQIRYGADVINRIIESQKPGGHERLQNAIIKETLNPMISNMCRAAKISSQQIYRAAIAGNTTMEHLMMGINADPLRMEPYIPAFFKNKLTVCIGRQSCDSSGRPYHSGTEHRKLCGRRYYCRHFGQHDLEPAGDESLH